MAQSRQLAAIMFTDIVGYTALMGDDEQKAFEILNKSRKLQKPIIEQYGGRWIKELGDGVLASFNTVSDAVNAAIKIQEACNVSKDFLLRIGIHHGEVVFEENDIFGDAVNIASRLQALAPIGGIWISESVNNNVSNKKEINTKFVRAETLKNVKEPVKIYEVSAKGSANTVHDFNKEKNKQHSKRKKIVFRKTALLFFLMAIAAFFIYKKFIAVKKFTGKEKSIAVLHFTNMSSDKNNEYFSDGITEEITTQLSKIADLKVIARTSSMLYKDSKKSIKEIAEELGVSAILEGSVQKSNNKVRITAQLIDANTQEHIWADTYDRELKDIFTIQSEVSKQIANQLNAKMTSNEKKRIEKMPTDNPKAYEYYLQGNQLREKFLQTLKPEYYENSKLMFEKSIVLDPNYALAHAGLASLHNIYTHYLKRDSALTVLQVSEINKAYSISPDLDYVNSTMGSILQDLPGRQEEAYTSFRKAYEINPNNTNTLFGLAMLLHELGLTDERITLLKKAVYLDPLNASYLGFLGGAEVHLNRLEDGMQHLQTALRLEPNMFYLVDRIAYIYALKNNFKEAASWLQKFLILIRPEQKAEFYSVYGAYSAYCYAKLGNKQKALEISKHWRVYLALGMKEEALQKILKDRNQDYLPFKTHLPHSDFNIIRYDPRFLKLMEIKKEQFEANKKRFSIVYVEKE